MREGRFRPGREGRSGVEGRRVGRGDWEIWELGGGVEGCWERWIRREREREIEGQQARDHVANIHDGIDFWGPVSNFGIPLAAVMDTQKSPEL